VLLVVWVCLHVVSFRLWLCSRVMVLHFVVGCGSDCIHMCNLCGVDGVVELLGLCVV